MKKLIILFSFVLAICAEAKSQSDFKPEWNIGGGFGPTFSSISFVTFQGANPKVKNNTQYHGGLAVRYIAERNVGIIGELNFSQQGWESDFKDQNPLFKHSHSLTYIEMPIMTHIYFGNKVRFIVNLGPKFQYLISDKEEMSAELSDYLNNNPNTDMVTLQYNRKAENKFDYGLIGGLGMEFRTGIGYFSLEGRYYFGLGDVFNNKKNEYNFSRSANRILSAKLTYYIKLF